MLGFVIGVLSLCLTFAFFPYGYNCFYLLLASLRYKSSTPALAAKPTVVLQLPIYNERYVVSRLVDGCIETAKHYGRELASIQLLDDSTDETSTIIDKLCDKYQAEGYLISVLRRRGRDGYKAGALQNGLNHTKADYVAIFDCDFLPTETFLEEVVPHMGDSTVGMVQARWTHINEGYNTLTRAISLGIDGHFFVEQPGRDAAGCLLNFNGSGGIIRREALEKAGGWSPETLAEDLDLSYRLQLSGYRILYLRDTIVPCEVPSTMPAFKRQQSRWARGSIHTARKIIPKLVNSNLPLKQKIQGLVHLTYYFVHPLMLASFILCVVGALFQVKTIGLPVPTLGDHPLELLNLGNLLTLFVTELKMFPLPWLLLYVGAFFCSLATLALYSSVLLRRRLGLRERLWTLLTLTLIGFGISLSNSVSVMKGLFARGSGEFKRTPKYAIERKADAWKGKRYQIPLYRESLLEATAVIVGVLTLIVAIRTGNWGIVPILGWFTLSYAVVGFTTFAQSAKT